MMMENSTTKKIGINTLYLFIRKLINLFIAFYASRLLLERLGIDDFGLYGLVGSIVALFSALRGIFSSSIQRYINIAKGNDDIIQINKVFSIGVIIHIWIAIIFAVIVEIGGLIILPTLNIPIGSYNAAMWILQFSILTSVVTILTVPYDALIIANEKFNVYAVLSVIENILKLLIIFVLSVCSNNKVVVYSGLLFGVSLIMRFANSIYCRFSFGNESKYHKVKDSKLLKEMTSFAGWQFCGNMGYALMNSGLNLIINILGGVVVNAARAIAYQVNSAASGFIADINVSFQPKSMMVYACGDMINFWKLFYLNTKSSFSMSIIISYPIILCAENILKIWLGEVPAYSVVFLQWIMIYMIIRSIHQPIDLLFKAEGRLKWYQLTELVILILNIPISWISLKFGAPFWSVFAIMNIIEIINLSAIISLAKMQLGLKIIDYLKKFVFKGIFVLLILSVIYLVLKTYILNNCEMIVSFLICVLSIPIILIIIFIILFSKNEKTKLMTMLLKK